MLSNNKSFLGLLLLVAGGSSAALGAAPLPQAADMPPAVAASTGPRGTSGDQQRYDAVGYAGVASGAGAAISATHGSLPPGSIAEVTALDTGRTILVLITDGGSAGDHEIELSHGAGQLLGLTAPAPVRVRLTMASPQDQRALRDGQAASARIDAPVALLVALRRKLQASAAAAVPPQLPQLPPPSRPTPGAGYAPPVAPRPLSRPAPVTAGIFVQLAALSNEGRAEGLATELSGRVQRRGALYRVQIGPYANRAAAQRARDDVARRGYADARIVTTN